MIERQTRAQIAAQDVRERVMLGRLFSPTRWVLHAGLGIALMLVAVGMTGHFA